MTAIITKPSKLAIANSFSKAALQYDKSASLQRMIGHKLLSKLVSSKASTVIDLGCGTGYFTKQLTQYVPESLLFGVDLAEGMLKQARETNLIKSAWLVGDAELLPFKDQSVDIVFSNLALQWCHDFSNVLSEVHRILKPQGIFLFTSLCEGTLTELKQSWRAVDQHIHVNHFMPLAAYQGLIDNHLWSAVDCQCVLETAYYPTVQAIMADLKGIGAHNINPERHKGLRGRQQIKILIATYEQFRDIKGLPASYQVLYGYLVKRS